MDLPLPGRQRGERHDQQEGAVQLVLMEQVVEEADRLDGFAQTHLVSQDAAVASGKKTQPRGRKGLLSGIKIRAALINQHNRLRPESSDIQ